MRSLARFQTALVSVAALGLLAPPPIRAAEKPAPHSDAIASEKPSPSEPLVSDVALQARGTLTGCVVGQGGMSAVRETVFISRGGAVVATCQTDASGRFTLAGLTGGVYEVRWAQGATICRLWAPQTAPPSAVADLQLSANAPVVRGQTGTPNPCSSLLKGPLPWIAAVATIIGLAWWDIVVSQKHHYERDHPSAS